MDYHPATGIKRYLTSTPPILSAKAIEPGIDLMIEAGMDRIREKSIKQSSFLLELFQQFLKPLGFSLGSPEQAIHRGSHLSIRHPQAYRICQALLHPPDGSPKVVPDFRAPDNIRLGITPLYTRFEDLYRAVVRIVEVVESGEWERVGREAGTVT